MVAALSWGARLKAGLARTRDVLNTPVTELFARGTLDESSYEALETALLQADCGVAATQQIVLSLKKQKLRDGAALKAALKAAILAAVASLALASPASAQTQWIMASGYPENNFMTQNLRKWVEDVEKGTSGKLKITLHTNDSLIKLDSIKGAIQRGQVQGGEIRLGVYGNEDPIENADPEGLEASIAEVSFDFDTSMGNTGLRGGGGSTHKKQFTVSIDDGPLSQDAAMRQFLDSYNVRTMFFVVGQEAERRPDDTRALVSAGHVLGNHTWAHEVLTGLSNEAIRRTLRRTDAAVTRITGIDAVSGRSFMRFNTSMPLMFGIMMSRRMQSGGCAAIIASARCPSTAVSTV